MYKKKIGRQRGDALKLILKFQSFIWNSSSGTKTVDADTGLIYFKYDFGYEFGILFPGEGKKFIGSSSTNNGIQSSQTSSKTPTKRILPPRYGDIELPVHHERTPHNRVTYAPYNIDNRSKRYSLPIDLNIDNLHREEGYQNNNNGAGETP